LHALGFIASLNMPRPPKKNRSSWALWFCILIGFLLFVWPAYYQVLIPINFSRVEALKGTDLPPRTLSLTFDDGPSTGTLELAQYLSKEQILATFFVIGKKIAGHEAQLTEMKRAGHLIGNHTWSHPDFNHGLFCVRNSNAEEISHTNQQLSSFVDEEHLLFHPPFGRWNHCLMDSLHQTSLERYVGPIVWDIDGRDWECERRPNRSTAQCGKQYLDIIQKKRSGVVLMHDALDPTTDLVKWLIPRLKKKGYKFVRLDDVPLVKQALAQKHLIAKH
jgi:peptidoglycan-N-acetylglucosamine deacetylase